MNSNDFQKRRVRDTILHLPSKCKTQHCCSSYLTQGKILVKKSVIHLMGGFMIYKSPLGEMRKSLLFRIFLLCVQGFSTSWPWIYICCIDFKEDSTCFLSLPSLFSWPMDPILPLRLAHLSGLNQPEEDILQFPRAREKFREGHTPDSEQHGWWVCWDGSKRGQNMEGMLKCCALTQQRKWQRITLEPRESEFKF